MQNVNCSHFLPFFYMVVACIIANVLSGLSVKQEIKGLMTNYVTKGRKPVYLSSLVLRLVSFASS